MMVLPLDQDNVVSFATLIPPNFIIPNDFNIVEWKTFIYILILVQHTLRGSLTSPVLGVLSNNH
jgi:hypothetical protein